MNQLNSKRRKQLLTTVNAYQMRGKSLRQIATAMGYKNVNSISYILKNYK